MAVLGSTGSIGRQALDLISAMPGCFEVTGLAAGGDQLQVLAQQAMAHRVPVVAVAREEKARELQCLLPGCRVLAGSRGVEELAQSVDADVVLCAIVGIAGLAPALAAAKAGKRLALANKEALVAAGDLLVKACRSSKALLVPVDSEHSAVFQCLQGQRRPIRRVMLTASGGPFRDWPGTALASVTVKQALAHPNWSMGPKITVDSATLVNKGLEVIEAHFLFSIPYDSIEVYVHRQSVVHSLVELADGSVLAQLGWPDMKLAIAYALTYPRRLPLPLPPFNLVEAGSLTFEHPRRRDFPGLDLGYEAGRAGGTMPAVYNAANEVAVQLFLEGWVRFVDIPRIIGRTMQEHNTESVNSVEQVLAVDAWARQRAATVAGQGR